MTTQICPYCSETIPVGAKKCKFCGEWLEPQPEREGGAPGQRGSADSRAVTRGLKQKQFDDTVLRLGIVIGIISGALAAYLLGTLGVKGYPVLYGAGGVMLLIWLFFGWRYWHE